MSIVEGFDARAAWFHDHYETVRGRIRLALILERLAEILPPPPARILDAGGGSGIVAIPLAERGYDVTLIDASRAMVEIARNQADERSVPLTTVQGRLEEVPTLTLAAFDAVCCHAVLMYVEDPASALRTLRSIAKAGAVLSVLEKNRDGLSIRPGFSGDYAEATRVLDDPISAGNLGISNRARSFEGWHGLLAGSGWTVTSCVGIRLFSDGAPDDLTPERFAQLLDLEREAGRRASYRSVARLIHIAAIAS